MPIAKTITYENLPDENKKDPKILPFKYKKPFPQEIEEIEAERGDLVGGENNRVRELLKRQETHGLSPEEKIELRELIKTISAMRQGEEGIMSQVAKMSNKDLREFYGGYLVPYGYKEDQIMRMPMKELEYLFNTVMNI